MADTRTQTLEEIARLIARVQRELVKVSASNAGPGTDAQRFERARETIARCATALGDARESLQAVLDHRGAQHARK